MAFPRQMTGNKRFLRPAEPVIDASWASLWGRPAAEAECLPASLLHLGSCLVPLLVPWRQLGWGGGGGVAGVGRQSWGDGWRGVWAADAGRRYWGGGGRGVWCGGEGRGEGMIGAVGVQRHAGVRSAGHVALRLIKAG